VKLGRHSLLAHDSQTVGGVESLVWDIAVQVYGGDLPAILNDLLNGYARTAQSRD
jgi:hypothetical protein